MIVIRYEDAAGNEDVVADQNAIPSADVDEVIDLDVAAKSDTACIRPCIEPDHVATDKAPAEDDLTASAYEDRQTHEAAATEKYKRPDLAEGQPYGLNKTVDQE